MQVEIFKRPGSAAAKLKLASNEVATAEAGKMIAMGGVSIETTTHKKGAGGIGKALKRLLTGESFFMNHYTGLSQGGEVWVAPTLNGDCYVHELNGDECLIVQSGSYLASDHDVDLDMSFQGFGSLFSGESIFWIKVSGRGKVVLSSFGCIYAVPVNGEYIVDTGHIVAFQDSLKFKISKAGGSWFHSFLGGEGLVCRFQGQGTVWCQSHNPSGFGHVLGPLLRPKQR